MEKNKRAEQLADEAFAHLEAEVEAAVENYERAHGPITPSSILESAREEAQKTLYAFTNRLGHILLGIQYPDERVRNSILAHEHFVACLELAETHGRPAYEKARALLNPFLEELEQESMEDGESYLLSRELIRYRAIANNLDVWLALDDKKREEAKGEIFDPAHGAIVSTKSVKDAEIDPLIEDLVDYAALLNAPKIKEELERDALVAYG